MSPSAPEADARGFLQCLPGRGMHETIDEGSGCRRGGKACTKTQWKGLERLCHASSTSLRIPSPSSHVRNRSQGTNQYL
ncbi:hypothetical protein L226DRAFT_539031, partial [Lentinus tigrinus ALCF2SS1-7]|uniref:uncharacterized protein n=1 Tax=Lentinus tigrinus ALCF2SS1-7 TaxID=1328758 RepID=UPI001165F57D